MSAASTSLPTFVLCCPSVGFERLRSSDWLVEHRFKAVAIGIVHESCVIGASILRTQSKGTGVAAPGSQSFGMEAVNAMPVMGAERHMCCHQQQLSMQGEATIGKISIVPHERAGVPSVTAPEACLGSISRETRRRPSETPR